MGKRSQSVQSLPPIVRFIVVQMLVVTKHHRYFPKSARRTKQVELVAMVSAICNSIDASLLLLLMVYLTKCHGL
jgi:hypothetical protein